MRLAVLSDIHANLEALTAVLEDIDKRGADKIVCLGDIVDWGPNPKECLDRIKERVLPTDVREKVVDDTSVHSRYIQPIVRGNHEDLVVDFEQIARLKKEYDREIAMWTRAQLGEYMSWMRELPYHLMIPQGVDGRMIHLVHGEATQPERFKYLKADGHEGLTWDNLIEMHPGDIMFCGHTHRQAIFIHEDKPSDIIPEWKTPPLNTTAAFHLEKENTVIVNVGAVSTPRIPGDDKATYVTYDGNRVTFYQVEYERKKTIVAIGSIQGVSEPTKGLLMKALR